MFNGHFHAGQIDSAALPSTEFLALLAVTTIAASLGCLATLAMMLNFSIWVGHGVDEIVAIWVIQ